MRKTVASIEARMTSTRLPGKILMTCVDKPILELMVERVKRSSLIDDIVIATTTRSTDDETVNFAKSNGISYFRGSEKDVVRRVSAAMKKAKADVVVQLTGDCPLIDPDIIDEVTKIYLNNNFDYVSNTLVRSYPRGLDVQVASLGILQESLSIAKDDQQHEHLFLSIYENPHKYKLFNVLAPPELYQPDYRWTLDTKEDFVFIESLYKYFYKKKPHFNSHDIINYLNLHPEIVAINKNIKQKPIR